MLVTFAPSTAIELALVYDQSSEGLIDNPLKPVVMPTSPDHCCVLNAYSIDASGLIGDETASAFAETPSKVTKVTAIIRVLLCYDTPYFRYCFAQSCSSHESYNHT